MDQNAPDTYAISIHALVKRATHDYLKIIILQRISIHALVKRATSKLDYVLTGRLHFNPRPREEGDADLLAVAASKADFNPRPREEGDRRKT